MTKLKNKPSLENGEIPIEQLEALRRGDHQAYKAVYMYYRGPIQSFLYGLLRSREEAEEISQHVFLVLWEKRGSLDVSKNIRTLLYTIARNAVMNLYKRLSVINKYQKNQDMDERDHQTAEDILIAREDELLMDSVVKRLAPMQRKVFEMIRRDNLSHDEVAERLNISKQNVANHLSQALKKMKQAFCLPNPCI